MTNTKFTPDQYLDTVRREIQKRITTYPKIIKKKEKKGMPKLELFEIIMQQQRQVIVLTQIEYLLIHGEIGTHISIPLASEMLAELQREYKMRKRYYPRLIYFKRITEEVAEYEKTIWAELIEYFKEKHMPISNISI